MVNVLIESAAQIVHDPLADAGGEIFFSIRTDRADDGDDGHGKDGEVEHGVLIVTGDAGDDAGEPGRQGLGLEEVVDDDFERPGVEQVGDCFAEDNQGEGSSFPVRA